jgi:RND superfamily putative drug exporter
MTPTGLTGKLARNAAQHPWRPIAAWALVLVIALATMIGFGERFTVNEEFRTDLESRVANDLITERLNGGVEDPAQERVIVSSDEHTVDSPGFRTVVMRVAEALGVHPEVARIETYYDAGMEELVSFDRHRTVIVTTLEGDPVEAVQTAQPVLETIEALRPG